MIPVLLSRRQHCRLYPLLRKPNSPTDFAYVEVLIACPPSATGRVAPYALSSIFGGTRSSHAARYVVFLLGIQCVQLCIVCDSSGVARGA